MRKLSGACRPWCELVASCAAFVEQVCRPCVIGPVDLNDAASLRAAAQEVKTQAVPLVWAQPRSTVPIRYNPAMSPDVSNDKRVTLRTVRHWVGEGRRIPMLTCYDATTAQWLWRGGVRTLLVGDTAAQFILGHDSTLPAPMSFMLQITAAVRRGAPLAFIMADMPFGSYQCGDDEAMRNAMAFMTQADADVVKLEVDSTFEPLVRRLSHAGVPVVAHMGTRPQLKAVQGRYRTLFRTQAEVDQAVDAAMGMIDAGAVMLLIEAVPAELTQQLIDRIAQLPVPVPVIGCGAGPQCHGHVIVLHDLLGLTDWHAPFAQPVTDLGRQISDAAGKWVQLVESRRYLRDDHPYHL
jgi:3-methyl-2-oxobutanoate hydroxymethyltransferase